MHEPKRLLFLLASFAIIVSCGGSAPPAETQPVARRPPAALVDVSSVNRPPAEEIDALLRGDANIGVAENTTRIAVPPWKVLGSADRAWMGEAAATIAGAELSRVEGTSVLERDEIGKLIDELRKANDEAGADVVKSGKLLGARLIVTGKMFPASAGRTRGVVRAVRVEDGVWLPAVDVDLPEQGDWTAPVTSAVRKLVEGFGMRAPTSAAERPLAPAQLEQAARARRLQYEGKLVEAAASYARVFTEPTNAWSLEADYVTLMNDLGMRQWAVERATKTLARMPATAENACHRARLLGEKNRKRGQTEGAREAVRQAASCGDPAVLARALLVYAWAFEDVHTPHAMAALDRARSALGNGEAHAHTRCYIDMELQRLRADEMGDPGDAEDAGYEAVGQRCERAGNLRAASIAFGNAALRSWNPARRLALRKRALELAASVGGSRLDDAHVNLARELRAQGKPSEADDLLLKALGERLRAIASVAGGLPDPEGRLDADLLRRAGVGEQRAVAAPGGGQDLVHKAHRTMLARLLREWAERTRAESVGQADVYQSIANRLDEGSDDAAPGADAIGRAKRALDRAGLPLDKIEQSAAAPPYAAGHDARGAMEAIWDWFAALRDRGAETLDERDKLVAAARKLADWSESARARMNALRIEAMQLADRGKQREALAAIQSARRIPKDHPRWTDLLNQTEVSVRTQGPKDAALGIRRESIAAAKSVSPQRWVAATYDAGYAAIGVDQRQAIATIGELEKVAAELEQSGALQDAALALERAARLHNAAYHVEGSEKAVELFARRTKLIDRLGDSLRSLEARVEALEPRGRLMDHTFRNRSPNEIARNPAITAAMREIADAARALVAAKRERDAVRIVARISPSTATGVRALVQEAMNWSERLGDSAERPSLVAKLWSRQASNARTNAERDLALEKSRDAYVEAKDAWEAIWQMQRLTASSADEPTVHRNAERCLELFGAAGDEMKAQCIMGVGDWLINHAVMRVAEPERFKKWLDVGLGSLPRADSKLNPASRQTLRDDVAVIAAAARDFAALERMSADVRRYYTQTAPNAYQWVTHLSRVARATNRANAKLAVDFGKEFERARGASDYWRAMDLASFGAAARRAGDAAAEKAFVEAGRQLAETRYGAFLHRYDAHGAIDAAEKKKWFEAERLYDAAAASARKRGVEPAADEMEMGRALVRAMRGDRIGALKALEPHVRRAREEAASASRSPCLDARVLEIAGALELAGGQCDEGKRDRDLAAARRDACMPTPTCTPVAQGEWCDARAYRVFRANNECRQPATFEPELLP